MELLIEKKKIIWGPSQFTKNLSYHNGGLALKTSERRKRHPQAY